MIFTQSAREFSLGFFLKLCVIPVFFFDFRRLHRIKRTVHDTVNSTTMKVYTASNHRLGFGLSLSFPVGPTEVAATIIKQTVSSK